MSHSSGAQVEYVAQGDVLNTTSESFGITIHRAANVALSFFMALLLFALGCSIDVSRVKAHVWRPWGILVGLLCQFGVMPLAAFLLALASAVKPVQAVAFLIMGCSPGGTLSNIVTFWIDGDMDLSITMTSVSTVLALGMMPLCLLVYTRRWVDTGMIRMPYSKIGITLVCMVVPVGLGACVNYKWPKVAKVILKVGTTVCSVLVLTVAILSSLLYPGSWNTDPAVVVVAVIFPLIGCTVGFICSVLLSQSWQRCRTIAVETGAQNFPICVSVLQLSFSPGELVHMLAFPFMYGACQIALGLLLITAFQTYKRIVALRSAKFDLPEPTPDSATSSSSVPSAKGEVNTGFQPDEAQQPSSSSEV
ncbi:sodium-dependent organic anion transporter-like [Engraulis encrasicolus]|uniref:sodium-dependent organic anion transporter-like n=1 Tax=Engraulis encrasicolus TaxID=184585 RepID=UPI002FD3D48A